MEQVFHADKSIDNQKIRLDSYLTETLPDMSRSHIQTLIRSGEITVNGIAVKPGYALNEGDTIRISERDPEPAGIEPEDIPLDIVYEDSDVIVINKPKGMVVHPANGHYTGTLVNALLYHCRDSLSGINGELRPGIVHRIDMDTTGLIIACKNDRAHTSIAAQLEEHSITRRYIALCYHNIAEDSGTIDKPLDRSRTDRKLMAVCRPGEGRNAVTHYRVLERFPVKGNAGSGNTFNPTGLPLTLIECRLETGRTHQIRVHMASIGHPLLGDGVYGAPCPEKGLEGQCLHARELKFIHPRTGEAVHLATGLPAWFTEVLSRLGPEE